MADRKGKSRSSDRFYFLRPQITVDGECIHEIKRYLLLGRKTMTNLDSIFKSRDITLLKKVKAIIFFSSHVWMWELDYKEGWEPKNGCFWILLEKTLESPLDCKEIKQVNPKGNQPGIFIGRTDAEAEAPIFWPPDVKSQLIGKYSDAGKIESRRKRGWQRMRWLDDIIDSMDLGLRKLWEMVKDRKA